MAKLLLFSALLVALLSVALFFINKPEDLTYSYDTAQQIRDLKLDAVEGNYLRGLVFFLEHWPTNYLLSHLTRIATRFDIVRKFASTVDLAPSWTPLSPPSLGVVEDAKAASQTLEADLAEIVNRGKDFNPRGFRFVTAADYVAAYRTKRTTPLAVARKLLENIEASNKLSKPLGAYIKIDAKEFLAQAEASTKRYQEGKTLSVLDGVPLAIKDEIDVKGYTTSVGTSFIHEHYGLLKEDAFSVAQARKKGLLIAGKLNMQEIGIGVTGHNPHHGIARNPYNLSYYPGGSSSGSGSAVGSGLVPFSIGADGGGSVRIPAGLCGVVGLKPTYGRVSESGAFPLCWSVGHLGPLGASVSDAALLYAVMSGPDPHDRNSQVQPPLHLHSYFEKLDDKKPLAGLRVGVHPIFTKKSDPLVVQAYEKSLEWLQEKGAELVEISIPHLEALGKSHTVLIVTEMSTAMDKFKVNSTSFGLETRASLALAHTFTSRDYVAANKARAWALRFFEDIFKKVDLIVSPTTSTTAPKVREQSREGVSDITTTIELIRYTAMGNFIGNPAISVPVGYDEATNLPIGLHFTARNWEEDLLLRVARVLEELVEHRKPEIYFQNF